jgi:hypothetical protein
MFGRKAERSAETQENTQLTSSPIADTRVPHDTEKLVLSLINVLVTKELISEQEARQVVAGSEFYMH